LAVVECVASLYKNPPVKIRKPNFPWQLAGDSAIQESAFCVANQYKGGGAWYGCGDWTFHAWPLKPYYKYNYGGSARSRWDIF
jgi:hypothetical protein